MDLNYNFQAIAQIKNKPHSERVMLWKKARRQSLGGFLPPLQFTLIVVLWLLAGWSLWRMQSLWVLRTLAFLGVLLFFTELSKLFFLNFMKVTVDKTVGQKKTETEHI